MKKQESDFFDIRKVPTSILYAREINNSVMEIYITLFEYAEKYNNCIKISTKELASELNYSVQTINRGLKKLIDLKLIEIVKTSGFTNEYKMLDIADSLLKRKILTEEDYLKFMGVKID